MSEGAPDEVTRGQASFTPRLRWAAHLSPDADGRRSSCPRSGHATSTVGRWRPGGGRSRRAHTQRNFPAPRHTCSTKTTSVFSCKGFQAGVCRAFADACGGADVYYAGKAFLCTAVARWVMEERALPRVCSGGELAVAQRLVSWGADRIPRQQQVGRRAAPHSPMAWDGSSSTRLTRSTDRRPRGGTRCRRVRHDPRDGRRRGPHARKFIATGHEDQKFGLRSPAAWPSRPRAEVLAHPDRLRLLGLHSHIGTRSSTPRVSRPGPRLIGLHARIAEESGHRAGDRTSAADAASPTPANTRP